MKKLQHTHIQQK